MYDIIIIGGGPAGLTAAIYATRASKKVLVLESTVCGGQIINANNIENYPTYSHISGFDFANKLVNQVKKLGGEIIIEKAIKIIEKNSYKIIVTEKSEYKSKSVILATGTSHRKLILDNVDKLIGKGVSYCATCDGAFYKDKIVAVIGGGNTALEDAIYLSDIAKKVYLIHRRNEFRADKYNIDILNSKNNIEVLLDSEVTKVLFKEKLEAIEINCSKKIEIDGLFIAIGRIPENKEFADLIELDKEGYVVSLHDCNTNVDGIFVAGDNREKEVRQLVTATADGAIAAIEAIKYINNKDIMLK